MNRNIMKKLTAFALAGTMSFSLAACGGTAGAASKTTSDGTAAMPEIAGDLSGGWELNVGALSMESNAAAKEAFEKATSQIDGYEYEAVALLGTQVVAGTNYSILAKGCVVVPDATPAYEIITVYQDLEGNATLTDSKTLLGGEEADGGFTVNDGEYDVAKNEDVKVALDKAMEKTDGAEYEAVVYLGSQIVQGTNYLILMRETPVVPNAKPEFVLVTVSKDLDGNAGMSTENITDLI